MPPARGYRAEFTYVSPWNASWPQAAIAVARKLAVIMHAMLKSSELFNREAAATACSARKFECACPRRNETSLPGRGRVIPLFQLHRWHHARDCVSNPWKAPPSLSHHAAASCRPRRQPCSWQMMPQYQFGLAFRFVIRGPRHHRCCRERTPDPSLRYFASAPAGTGFHTATFLQ